MASIDYAKAAKSYGGEVVDAPSVDYAREAAKFGGEVVSDTVQTTAPAPNPTDGMSGFDLATAGAGKAVVDIGRGIGQMLNLVDRKDIEESRARDAALMDTPEGKIGNFAGSLAAFAPTSMIPGANTYTGSALIGAGIGLFQPSTSNAETATNVAFGAGGGLAGKRIGDFIGDFLSNRAVRAQARSVKADAIKRYQNDGYVIPPSDADAGFGSQVLGAFSGKIKTEQKASSLNQPVTNRKVAGDLGISPDEPITRETLATVRKNAGQSYEEVRGTGTVTADQTYKDALAKLGQANANAAKDFPELADTQLQDLIQAVNKDKFDASSAVDAIRTLRNKADAFYGKGEKQLGKDTKAVADAMEDMLGRHLQASGADPVLLSNFQNARQLIAKTYTAEKALNPSTGNINAQKLAAELNKGRPLSGGMKDAADFANSFRKSTQELPPPNPYSIIDGAVGAGGLGGAVLGGSGVGAGVAAAAAARPVLRNLILNPTYQRLMVKPSIPSGAVTGAIEGVKQQALPLSTLLGISLAPDVN